MIASRKTSPPTLTIGIPVYNEEKNITGLLKSILAQNRTDFRLDKVIVICDGTTDSTIDKVRKFRRFKQIRLVSYKKRQGKIERLNKLFQITTSDYLVIVDGDVIMRDNCCLDQLIKGFDDREVVLVSGNNQPVRSDNFLGSIIIQWEKLWYEVRKNYNFGNNIYNARSCFFALRRSFVRDIVIPKNIVSEGQFLFFKALEKGLYFNFTKNAVVYFRTPDVFKDTLLYFSQRMPQEKQRMTEIFGNWTSYYYKIPKRKKLKAIMARLSVSPIYFTLSLMLFLFFRLNPFRNQAKKNPNLWKTVTSTKKKIVVGESVQAF